MTRALPDHPHPDHVRRQARDLLRAWRDAEPAALARAAAWQLAPPWRLATAQLVIARELGLPSWPRLMDEVERRRDAALDSAAFIERAVTLALGRGWTAPQPARALRIIDAGRSSSAPVLALLRGDLPAVQRGLDPGALDAPLPPWQAPALVYAAASGLARLDAVRPALIATVDWLLANGADPNARWTEPGAGDRPLPVLYGAVSSGRCEAIVQRLLDAGAEPNDNESLYHACELEDSGPMAAVVRAGARWAGTNALFRQLDHDHLPGLAQALALGADPNERTTGGRRALHHALLRGRGVDSLRLLLAHGADPAAEDDLGFSPAAYALRTGDRAALTLLQADGVGTAMSPEEAFAAACAAGDAAQARALLARAPDCLRRLSPHLLRLLPEQAQRGRIDAVALMLQLGWPVAVTGDWDASALNQAAFRGDAAMARLLLDHGARWDERNGYGGTTLGSCLHAACNEPVPGGDYAAVLALLLDAGAPVPDDLDALPDALQAVVLDRT